MSKILVYNIPATGHINPTLPLIEELVKRGHQVVYTMTEGYRGKIEATGATFRAYRGIGDNYFEVNGLEGKNPPNTAATMTATARDMVPELLAHIETEAPDVIVFDSMCPWAYVAAKKAGIPSAASMSTLMITPGMVARSGLLLTLTLGVLRNLGYLGRFRRAALELERAYGVRLGGFVDALTAHGTITLVYTSALFQPGSDKLGSHIKYVGPMIAPRPHDANFPWDQLGSHRLIYVSLGTLVNNNPEFFRTCVQAFAGQPYQVVLSIGDKVDPAALGTIPDNCLVRRSVPQLEILERAALFISHAGMNSVNESLYYGVPLLMAPQQQEQTLTATRVEQLGAGLRLRPPITPRSLLDAATLILTDDGYRSTAQRIRDSFRRAGGISRAADEILRLADSTSKS